MPLRFRFPRRFTWRGTRAWMAPGAAALVWLATAVIVVSLLAYERDQARERARRNAEALAQVLEAHTARTFQAVEITLAGVSDTLQLTARLAANDARFRKVLKERLAALSPYARAIFVIGPDGFIVHDTDYPSTPKVSLADRPYFIAQRDDPARRDLVSGPYQSRSGLGWFLAVSRRIGEADFRGIAVAAVQPQYFESLYRSLGLGEADVISLYHRDGTLIARYPSRVDQVGESFAAFPLFAEHLQRNAAGSYIAKGGAFDFRRLVSYRALDALPLVVVVNQDMANVLAAWHIEALGAAAALGAFGLLLAILVVQFLRHQRLRDLSQERSARSEKLEALGHLTGGVSHDFANLLHVIGGSLRLLSHETEGRPRAREALAVAERAMLRGGQLIDRLRAFAQRQPLHVHAADLNALIRSGEPLLRQLAGPRLALEHELGAELAPCLVDDTELEVALVNLLVNARDAGAKRVLLKTYNCSGQEAGYVCLAVRDDGGGMSEDVRRHAFEPYYTTKGKGGTGLGLPQVYGFLHQIGGDVQVESQPGQGTTIRLLLPRAPLGAAQPASMRASA